MPPKKLQKTNKPVEKPVEEPVEETVEEPVEETVEEPVEVNEETVEVNEVNEETVEVNEVNEVNEVSEENEVEENGAEENGVEENEADEDQLQESKQGPPAPKVNCEPEFRQAIEDSLKIIGESYDLSGDPEMVDFIKSTFVNRFAHVKPREVQVQVQVPVHTTAKGKAPRKKTGYNEFISHMFAENKKNPTGESTVELMTKFSKEWKELPPNQQQIFKDMADKKNLELGFTGTTTKAAPARPMSGYNYFLKQNSAKIKELYPSLDSKQRMAQVAAAWKSLTDAQKEEYKQGAIEFFNKQTAGQPAAPAAPAAAPTQVVVGKKLLVTNTKKPATVTQPLPVGVSFSLGSS